MFIASFGYAQNDISDLMDDGTLPAAKNMIKTDLSQFLKANIPLIWEHRFNAYSFEFGVGLLTHNFFEPVIIPKNQSGKRKMYENLNGGYSIHFSPNFYFDGFDSFHCGLQYDYHHHYKQAVSHECCCIAGRQWVFAKRIAIDVNLGLGLNWEKSLDGKSYIFEPDIINEFQNHITDGIRIVAPLSIKLGYIF